MDWMWILSGFCIVFTLGMFSTGLSDLRVMVTKRSVENIQFLPFLTTDLNNIAWFYYGYLKGDGTLITVNFIGASLQSLYMVVYVLHCPEKRSVGSKILISTAVLVLAYCYFNQYVADASARLNQLGLFCSIFTISMYLSPLADLANIIKTKSTKCLSFPLTVATFLTSTSWVLYGLALSDLYIMVPNFPGIVTSLVRFWLFWRFPPEQPSYRPLQA